MGGAASSTHPGSISGEVASFLGQDRSSTGALPPKSASRRTTDNPALSNCIIVTLSVMAPSLLRPQAHLANKEVLELAHQAPTILRKNPRAFSTSPLLALFSAPETPELWIIYENLLLACLRIGDDVSAQEFLERLVVRFGEDNQRIMALRGLVREAQAANNAELEGILEGYNEILEDSGNKQTNIVSAGCPSVYGDANSNPCFSLSRNAGSRS